MKQLIRNSKKIQKRVTQFFQYFLVPPPSLDTKRLHDFDFEYCSKINSTLSWLSKLSRHHFHCMSQTNGGSLKIILLKKYTLKPEVDFAKIK